MVGEDEVARFEAGLFWSHATRFRSEAQNHRVCPEGMNMTLRKVSPET